MFWFQQWSSQLVKLANVKKRRSDAWEVNNILHNWFSLHHKNQAAQLFYNADNEMIIMIIFRNKI